MGLDMYLDRESYVQNWDHQSPEERHTVTVEGPMGALIDPTKVANVTERVGYWRKANAIHNWFVQNVGGGVDECQRMYVSLEQLYDLLFACEGVLMAHEHGGDWEEVARETLPPASGFFFGSTELDEWYLNDLRDTVKIIREVTEPQYLDTYQGTPFLKQDIYYQASW